MRLEFRFFPREPGESRCEGFWWTQDGIDSLFRQIKEMIYEKGNLIVTWPFDTPNTNEYVELGRVVAADFDKGILTVETGADFPSDAAPETHVLGSRVFLDYTRDGGPIGADVHLLNFSIRLDEK